MTNSTQIWRSFPVSGHEAYTNLGVVLQQRGEIQDSIAAHHRAIALNPRLPQAHANLGNVLVEAGDTSEGIAAIRRAISLSPDSAEIYYNLGCGLSEAGDGDLAVSAFQKAISLDSDHAEAHFNLAFEFLRLGQWGAGWSEYEWRWQRDGSKPFSYPQPQWKGDALNGRTILLHAEQGLGDTLHFIRYATAVAEKGGACGPAGATLFASAFERVIWLGHDYRERRSVAGV